MIKQCNRCNQSKEMEINFYKDNRTSDGYRHYCKQCFLQYNIDNPNQRGTGLQQAKGEDQWRAKLTESDVLTIREELKQGVSRRELAERFNISYENIKSIEVRRTWKHI